MAGDSPGQGLARRFYEQLIAPQLDDVPHAAALLGDGSEVLGYDDAVSPDHDFGPRVHLFLAACAGGSALAGVPARFEGWSEYRIEVSTAPEFFTSVLGVDPADGMSLADWLLTPTQRFAGLTAGSVFHDPAGALARRRTVLAWYPDDVWRYVLAAGWLRFGQEQPFLGRAGGTGDELGSAILAARLVRDLIRLAFLVERRWAPYSKWLGRAFADLSLAAEVGPPLRAALAADGWRGREVAMGAAATAVAVATNRLGLADPVDPASRRFYTRDIRVVAAEELTESLTAAITDPELRALVARLGQRGHGETVGALPGAIDQAVDSTDVLTRVDRCRAAAPVLGLASACVSSRRGR